LLQVLGQRVANLDIEVIGRLVEKKQVRLLAHQQREREPRLLPTREFARRCADPVTPEIESAEKVTKLLLARVGLEPPQMPQCVVLQSELLDLVLREIADAQTLRGQAPSRGRRKLSGHRAQQRRLAGAVRSEQAD